MNKAVLEGIPTEFLGRKFRSRLEAKWAAFFHLAGWEWEYEPFDLNGYIPDFVIHGREKWQEGDIKTDAIVPILVEVKPIVGEYDTRFNEIVKRLSQWNGEALILSYFLPVGMYGPYLGWLREDGYWDFAAFQRVKDTKAEFGFCHNSFSYHDRISGFYDGSSGERNVLAERLWREAGNAVQWHPI